MKEVLFMKKFIFGLIVVLLLLVGHAPTRDIQAISPGGVGYSIAETFPDPNMAQAVANKIAGGNIDHQITQTDINLAVQWRFQERNISSIEGIEHFINLMDLDFDSNQLSTIPDSIGSLTKLTDLSLVHNELVNLPDSIGNLTNLAYLALDYNRLETLPDSIGNLTKLFTLRLDFNQLLRVPDSIGNLTDLYFLGLSHNQLVSLPDSIGNLNSLSALLLSSNQLLMLPDSIGDLTNLTNLQLTNNQLSILPTSVDQLSMLTELYLSSNKFSIIPESILNLTNLMYLYLQNNEISEIPENIGNLTKLRFFDVSTNQLSTLPDSVGNLTNLAILNVSSNRLSTLPVSFSNFSNLIYLYLDNQIVDLGTRTYANPFIFTAPIAGYGSTPIAFTNISNQGENVANTIVWNDLDTIGETLSFDFSQPITIGGANANLSGTASIEVEPLISYDLVVDSIENVVYDGTFQAVEPIVKDATSSEVLIKGIDYQVTYSGDTKNTGLVSVNISGLGTYAGSNIERSYYIVKATPVIISAPVASAVVVGSTLSNSTLSGGVVSTPATFNWFDNTIIVQSATSYPVTVLPEDARNYNTVTIDVFVELAAAPPIDINTIDHEAVANVVYTGTAHEPVIVLRDGGYALIEDTDYIVEYENNMNAGVARIKVTGIGKYEGEMDVYFTIEKAMPIVVEKPVASAVVVGSPLSNSTLSGGVVSTLATFNWFDNTTIVQSAASYPVTVLPEDARNYNTVTIDVFVELAAAQRIDINTIDREAVANVVYTGTAHEPVVVLRDGGNALMEDTDYIVEYDNNINAGVARIKVTGIGKYEGEMDVYFTIEKAMPIVVEKPVASAINQGQVLEKAALVGGLVTGVEQVMFTDNLTTVVLGIFTWSNPDIIVDTSGEYEVLFTPESGNYEAITTMVELDILLSEESGQSFEETTTENASKSQTLTKTGQTNLDGLLAILIFILGSMLLMGGNIVKKMKNYK